jgi:hypothetical protein
MLFTGTTSPYANYVEQYSANIDVALRQEGSLLRRAVREMPVKGEAFFVDQLGDSKAVEYVSRHMDSPIMNTERGRRGAFIKSYHWGEMLDHVDQIRQLSDPKSDLVAMGRDSIGEIMDEIIIGAALGNALAGKTGTNPIALPSTSLIAVDDHTFDKTSGAIGLTISKLQVALGRFRRAKVKKNTKMYCALSAMQLQNLISYQQTQDINYNSIKALVQGDLNTFMNFEFIPTELIPQDANGNDQALFFTEDAIRLGVNDQLKVDMEKRSDKCFNWYLYINASFGAVRLQEAKVQVAALTPIA